MLFFLSGALYAGDDPKKESVIAILPFSINAEKDLAFLREGIMDMLMTRLYWKDRVKVIEKQRVKEAIKDVSGPLDLAKASEIGKGLGADYVLFGSLTIFGESVSMDATMAPITKADKPVAVFVQTKGMESVIPEINTFAQKVNSAVFGRSIAEPEARVAQSRQGSGINPNFTYYDTDPEKGSFWRSRSIRKEVMGFDVADVNGDSLNEIVVLEETAVVVYAFREGTLARIASYDADDGNRFVWADAFDVNGNGRAEIFASKASGSSFSSVVLEMDGGKLKPLVKDSEWFYRVMKWPGQAVVLLGQQRMVGEHTGEVNLTDNFFARGIFRLVWNGKDYVKDGPKPLVDLKGVYIFNFVAGTLGKDTTPYIVALDWYEKLRLLTMDGNQVHRSNDIYGGTLNMLKTAENVRTETLRRDSFFVPSRMLIMDVDKDGSNELIVNQNKSTTMGLTERFRSFSDGKVVALTWDGLSFTPIWESRKLQGCLSSLQVTDLDNDGTNDLVVSLIQERGISLIEKARSAIVSYKLEPKRGDVK
jgi:TolB-like protein